MTAPGTSRPQPGRAAFAADRAAVVLWSLLLVGLLALLPCAGTAKAAAEPLPTPAPLPVTGARTAAEPAGPHTVTRAEPRSPHRPTDRRQAAPGPAEHGHAHTTPAPAPQPAVQAAHPQPPLTWCAADGDRPGPGSCSSHAFCGPEAQLPNAPPQPAAASLPQLLPVRALRCDRPAGALTGPDHAPDLHVLQVHRS